MESFLNRYRNITVLLLVIFAQLVLLAVQVKNDQDVMLIRVWAVTAVTPAARIVEGLRGGGVGFIRNYIMLHEADADNRRLQAENGRLKLENIFLKNELNTADRAKALQLFQAHTPSKTLAATVIGSGAGSNSKVVFVDRGTVSGVARGMAVVTPDGIVGKVIAAYPTASEVLLITDPEFAAGVVSQKSLVRGTLKGQGKPLCLVDYVPFEEKAEPGEWFYTSGDDRIFPRGFPVGVVRSVRPAQPFKEIYVEPSGLQHGLEDVLIIVEGVHQDLPDAPPGNQPVYIAPAPPAPAEAAAPAEAHPGPAGTEADKLRMQYKAIGQAQNHTFGEGAPGSKPPNFNLPLPQGQPAGTGATGASTPSNAAPPAATQPSVQTNRPVEPAAKPPAAVPKPAPSNSTAPGRVGPVPPPQPAKAPEGGRRGDPSAGVPPGGVHQ
jgi:rod shape-determining protein MreC